MSPEQSAPLLKLYADALNAAESVEAFSAEAVGFKRDEATARRLIQSLRQQSSQPVSGAEVKLPDSATAMQVQQALGEAEAELTARREAVDNLQQLSQQRTRRRVEIAKRIGVLSQHIGHQRC